MNLSIKAVVFNHNRRATAEALFNSLKVVCDAALFDSGSSRDQVSPDSTHTFPNLYWTGCWNKAFEIFPDADVIWGLGGDCTLDSPPENYLESMRSLYPFGLWSPAVTGTAHTYMQRLGNHAYTVRFIEGIAFAISRSLWDKAGPLDAENYLGHGQDLYCCLISQRHNLKNILDTSVSLSHPPSGEYDLMLARELMFSSLRKNVGEDWQDVMDWWWGRRVSFEANTISRIVLGGSERRFIRPFMHK